MDNISQQNTTLKTMTDNILSATVKHATWQLIFLVILLTKHCILDIVAFQNEQDIFH